MQKSNFDFIELAKIGLNLKKDLDIIPVYFVKTFSSEYGKKVLAYLISITLNRCLGANASSEELRFLEGQRYLVSFIQNMIKKGEGK